MDIKINLHFTARSALEQMADYDYLFGRLVRGLSTTEVRSFLVWDDAGHVHGPYTLVSGLNSGRIRPWTPIAVYDGIVAGQFRFCLNIARRTRSGRFPGPRKPWEKIVRVELYKPDGKHPQTLAQMTARIAQRYGLTLTEKRWTKGSFNHRRYGFGGPVTRSDFISGLLDDAHGPPPQLRHRDEAEDKLDPRYFDPSPP